MPGHVGVPVGRHNFVPIAAGVFALPNSYAPHNQVGHIERCGAFGAGEFGSAGWNGRRQLIVGKEWELVNFALHGCELVLWPIRLSAWVGVIRPMRSMSRSMARS